MDVKEIGSAFSGIEMQGDDIPRHCSDWLVDKFWCERVSSWGTLHRFMRGLR